MKASRSERPKNLETNRTAWAWESGFWIQSKHGLRTHVSAQPFRSTRQPLQLIFSLSKTQLFLSLFCFFLFFLLSLRECLDGKKKGEKRKLEKVSGFGVDIKGNLIYTHTRSVAQKVKSIRARLILSNLRIILFIII